jgi:endogenous inhibitor of DNA gyrase (YacG/DUF329 family)
LATEPSPQRAYRAACPNCGAPVEFRSAASAVAICSFCRSTIVREGEALRKIGESAELFDDHSPLQLGASGSFQGAGFTLVGRIQYRYADGTWNEWHALFDSGRNAWLSEDNGRYVLTVDLPLKSPPPPGERLQPGAQQAIDGVPFTVASVTTASVIAAQGELPRPPVTGRAFLVADLRSTRAEVGTLDYSEPAAPSWSVGRAVGLSELKMTGLAEISEKTLSARGVACPNCGAALDIKLSTTQSIVCQQCHAVVDLGSAEQKNIGGALAHYVQDNGSEPLIPLGSTGTLALGKQALPWQVVGYVERCEVSSGSDDDERSFWREYLLYHRTEGFAFLVDAEDGWSWVAPITGVPESAGEGAKYQGVIYRKLYDYTGEVTYVLGEFYWRLTRQQRTINTDYAGTGSAGAKRLNCERTRSKDRADGSVEVVWSAGETLPADTLAKAFRLPPDRLAAMQRDALPTSLKPSSLLVKILFWSVVVIVVLMLFRCSSGSQCSDVRSSFGANSNEYQSCLNAARSGSSSGYRTGGGSFGGFSSGGGGHK